VATASVVPPVENSIADVVGMDRSTEILHSSSNGMIVARLIADAKSSAGHGQCAYGRVLDATDSAIGPAVASSTQPQAPARNLRPPGKYEVDVLKRVTVIYFAIY
jgi:hypothetical protein